MDASSFRTNILNIIIETSFAFLSSCIKFLVVACITSSNDSRIVIQNIPEKKELINKVTVKPLRFLFIMLVTPSNEVKINGGVKTRAQNNFSCFL
jgi:siroheme synthase (precorrin-2 oxidase/ferrochelatase)